MYHMDTWTLGEQVRARRAVKGWTQKQLAGKAGLTRATVGHIEAGNDADAETVRRVAGALGCVVVVTLRDG